MSTRRARILLPAVVIAAAAALTFAATAGSSDDSGDGGQERHAEALIDWDARTVQMAHDRWTIQFCEGHAPAVCLSDADGNWGGVELTSWVAGDMNVLEDAFARGASEAEALEALADDFLISFEHDRREGCGPDYEFVPDAATPVTVAGEPGLRYGFRGVVDGVTIEHIVAHAVIRGDTLHLFNTAGLADDGCLGREGEFPMAAFDADTVDLVGRIVAASALR